MSSLFGNRRRADLDLRGIDRDEAGLGSSEFWYSESRDRSIILIHGYNVTEQESLKACGSFRDALAYYQPILGKQTFICTWPGNWTVVGMRGGAYPFMVPKAVDSGASLYNTIKRLYAAGGKKPAKLIIIAHSLGCRLTMEMLEIMRDKGRPAGLEDFIVFLMAAAVPSVYFDEGGRLHRALEVPNKIAVYYSVHDTVLSRFFKPGQLAAAVWGERVSEAVGLRGRPLVASKAKSVQLMRQYDHGDYWKELEMAERICWFLGIPISANAMALPLSQRREMYQRDIPMADVLPIYMCSWQ